MLSSVSELHQQRTSAEGSAGQLSLDGDKSLSGEIQIRAEKAQLKLYCCVYTRHFWFPTWAAQGSPFLSQALSSRAEAGVCSRDSDGQGQAVGPGVRRVLSIAPTISSPWEEFWLGCWPLPRPAAFHARCSQASRQQMAQMPFDRQGCSCCNLNTGKTNYPEHLDKKLMPEPRGHIQEH